MRELTRPLAELETRIVSRVPAVEKLGRLKAPISNGEVESDGFVVNSLRSISASFRYWRESWVQVIEQPRLSSDILAGMTVAAVALPLNVALAVSSGLPASSGIIAGAIGGALAAIFGGARLQVTGPAAALNVMVFAIVAKWGPVGAAAGALAVGILQLLFFVTRAATLARFIPEAVLAGFTTGVGLKLLDQQIPLLLDVDFRVTQLLTSIGNPIWLRDVHWLAVVSGLFVMLAMMGFSKFPKIPGAIAGLGLATAVSMYLRWDIHRVGEVPSALPTLAFPALGAGDWLELFVVCIPLAILATAESLLSARAVDRMALARPDMKDLKPHEPNLEAFGQGIGNIGASLFGGMPVSGVIVRSSVNVHSGSRTRLSALFHAIILLVAPLAAAKWIGSVPIAALAGLLCMVGYRLVEVRTMYHEFKISKLLGIAFVLSAVGVVTGYLAAGLVAGMIVAGLHAYLEKRKRIAKETPLRLKPKLGPGVRGKINRDRPDAFTRAAPGVFREPEENWQAHVENKPLIHPTAFVHPNASVVGRVVLGPSVHVATEAALRADEGTPFFVGEGTNVQDGVVLHALKKKWVEVDGRAWAIFIGDRCSLAHQSLVHGPSYIGDDTFVGFKAIVHDSIVGDGCFIGIGAIVVGVEIPDGRFVPHGMLVDTQEKAQSLPESDHSKRHFNEDVVEVNRGLAEAYKGDYLRPRYEAHALTKF